MRAFAVGLVWLIGSIAWAITLSFAPTAKPAVTFAQTAPPPTAELAAKSVQPSTVQAAVQPDAAPVKQPAAQTTAEPDVVQTAVAPDAKPAEQPIVKTVAPPEPAEQPIIQTAVQPNAKPADAPPVVQPVALPVVTLPPQPAAPVQEPAKAPAEEAAVACPGHPDAIGTSRVLTLKPGEYSLLGTMQYKQTLPLKDHEVVLTFDDGPIPPYTNSILDTLAANCVKATYFLVGEMARPRPYLVRRIYNEGHSIGTHTQNHPLAIQHMSMQRVERQVDGGIDSVDAALGDPKALSPFFRIPGLGRTNEIEHFLESKGLVTWSADIDTNDWWRGSTPGAIVQRAMRRLNARGRGILLMHDIHPATALALPMLLKELKAQGYHVVHVVAAGEQPKSLPEVVATPLEKENWPRVLHANAEKTGGAVVALRHKVKTALNHRHHRRAAQRKDTAQAEPSGDGLAQRLTQF